MRTVRALALILVLWPAGAARGAVPVGRYDYRLSWNGIPAASATIEVHREGTPEDSYRVEGVARTNWFVDLLWSLRARVVSRFSPEDLAPMGFRYDREIRGEPSLTDVVFHAAGGPAVGTLRRRGATKVVEADAPDLLDPVTAIFRALSRPLAAGEILRYEVFTGESRYRVELEVLREESVTVAGRPQAAWRVEPRLWKIGRGLEPRLREATIWVSRDPARTVLRVRSQVFIGAVSCDLLAVHPAS